MNINDVEPNELLSYGIDSNSVIAVQIRQFFSMMNSMADLPTTSSNSSPTEIKHEQQKTRSNSGNGDASDSNTPISPVSLSSVDVDSACIHQCLSKAVACCAFFHTFEEIDANSLNALSNAVAIKLDRMCGQLQILARRIKRGRPTAFTNPVIQVLHMNSLPLRDLLEFYHSRVIRTCQRIAEEYITERERPHKKRTMEKEQNKGEKTPKKVKKEIKIEGTSIGDLGDAD